MPYAIVTTDKARQDIREAIDWEDKRYPGLGVRFLADVTSTHICD